jgi:hypothetical protein
LGTRQAPAVRRTLAIRSHWLLCSPTLRQKKGARVGSPGSGYGRGIGGQGHFSDKSSCLLFIDREESLNGDFTGVKEEAGQNEQRASAGGDEEGRICAECRRDAEGLEGERAVLCGVGDLSRERLGG